MAEHIVISFQINYNHNCRNHVKHIFLNICREFQTITCIRFCNKIFPSPAIFGYTEHNKYHRTKRKNIVGHNKVFQIHNISSCSKRLNARQHIEAQNCGQGKQDHCCHIHQNCLFAAPSSSVYRVRQNILKHCNYSGQGREGHEQEKQGTPDSSTCHLVKNIWQCNKYKSRTCSRFHTKGKACGNNNQSCH